MKLAHIQLIFEFHLEQHSYFLFFLSDRRKKHVGFDTFVETTRHVRQVNDNSCSCKIGPVGPPGPPGIDGRNGNDGKPGLNGKDGRDAALTELPKAEDFCFECPEGMSQYEFEIPSKNVTSMRNLHRMKKSAK